jgi:hypothetical protein
VASHDVQCDDRVVRIEGRGQELIEKAQGTSFVLVATAGGSLEREEA